MEPAQFESVSASECEALIATIWSLTNPEQPQTPAEIAAYHGHFPPGSFAEYWVTKGRETAFALFGPNPNLPPERLTGTLCIHQDHEALASSVIEFCEERAGLAPTKKLDLWARSDKPTQIQILEARGYQLIQTVPVSFLDIQAFRADAFLPQVEGLPYRVASIAELISEGVDWIPKLFESTSEIARDVPDPHEHEPITLEQYREMLDNPVIYHHHLMFAAMDGERIVGYTRATPLQSDPTLVNTGLSGTIRSHRRQGIVTALKVRAILALKELGCRTLQTENDASNPMYDLNLQLGFKWAYDWRLYEIDT